MQDSDKWVAFLDAFDMYATLPEVEVEKSALHAHAQARLGELDRAVEAARGAPRVMSVEDDRFGFYAVLLSMVVSGSPEQRGAWLRKERALLEWRLHAVKPRAHLERTLRRLTDTTPPAKKKRVLSDLQHSSTWLLEATEELDAIQSRMGGERAPASARKKRKPAAKSAGVWVEFRLLPDLLASNAPMLPALCASDGPAGSEKATLAHHAAIMRKTKEADRVAWLERVTGKPLSIPLRASALRNAQLRELDERSRVLRAGRLWVGSRHYMARAMQRLLQRRIDALLTRAASHMCSLAGNGCSPPTTALAGSGLHAWQCTGCSHWNVGELRCASCQHGVPDEAILKRMISALRHRPREVAWCDGAVHVRCPPAFARYCGFRTWDAMEQWLVRLGFQRAATGAAASQPQTTAAWKHSHFHAGWRWGRSEDRVEGHAQRAKRQRREKLADDRLEEEWGPAMWVVRDWIPEKTGPVDADGTLRERLERIVINRGAHDNVVEQCGERFFCAKRGGGEGRHCLLKGGAHSSSNRGILCIGKPFRKWGEPVPRRDISYHCFSAKCKGKRLLLARIAVD